VFSPGREDVTLASVDTGPVALLRPGMRAVALGFHPGRTNIKFNLTTPLLLANILRWLQPDVFRGSELVAGSIGSVTLPLDADADPKQIRVLLDSTELPYTLHSGSLRFFAGAPGIVRVVAGGREQVFSLSLPEIADQTWTPPSGVRRGMPGVFERAVARDLWQILAVLGALGLLYEWWKYGRRRMLAPTVIPSSSTAAAGEWSQAS
jgi:hypothetical protein